MLQVRWVGVCESPHVLREQGRSLQVYMQARMVRPRDIGKVPFPLRDKLFRIRPGPLLAAAASISTKSTTLNSTFTYEQKLNEETSRDDRFLVRTSSPK